MATKESSSESKEEETGPKDSHIEASPYVSSSPISPTHMVPSMYVDVVSMKDLVNSFVPKQLAPPIINAKAKKPNLGVFRGKANAAAKGKFILDPLIGWTPTHVDFMASWSGDDISLVDKPTDLATTSAGGSTPLAAAGCHVKIEAPPRYLGKR